MELNAILVQGSMARLVDYFGQRDTNSIVEELYQHINREALIKNVPHIKNIINFIEEKHFSESEKTNLINMPYVIYRKKAINKYKVQLFLNILYRNQNENDIIKVIDILWTKGKELNLKEIAKHCGQCQLKKTTDFLIKKLQKENLKWHYFFQYLIAYSDVGFLNFIYKKHSKKSTTVIKY